MDTRDYLNYLIKKYNGKKIDDFNVQFSKYSLTIDEDDIRTGSLNYKNETYIFNYTNFKAKNSEQKALEYIEEYLRE